MDSVLRALVIYFVFMVALRLVGKRSLSDVTTFDFLLLLLVSEAAQQALLGDDFSLTNAALVAFTLLAAERISDYLQWRFPRVAKVTQSVPVVLVENGRLIPERMAKSHIDEDDILNAARKTQGLSRID